MIRLGILGCSEIAFRRFMPAVLNVAGIQVVAVSEEYDKSKLELFCSTYNLEGVEDFETLINREDIDAVYVPQPPALHYKWAKKALECGKHVLVEKPSTIDYELSKELVELASEKELALHENYMFQYHSQIAQVKEIVDAGKIGEVRLIRANFGFPLRQQNDFRYSAQLGGGALLDAGGYTLKLATMFLGNTIKVDSAKLNNLEGYEVDMYGNASLSNEEGLVCQIGFGMDCYYQCCLEIWGSNGRLYTNRIFTAPPDYLPKVTIDKADGSEEITLKADAHFEHSIETFVSEIENDNCRKKSYDEILLQARLVNEVRQK